MEKTFKTKTGSCHVTENQIILTRNGLTGNLAKVTSGNNIARVLIIYGLLSVGLIYFAYSSYLQGSVTATILYGLLAAYLVYGIIRSRNNSATPVIDRKDIRAVRFVAATTGLARPRFEIDFVERGKIKTRLILLPGSMTGGSDETMRALDIMRSEKLLV
jgi:hypothetical protein